MKVTDEIVRRAYESLKSQAVERAFTLGHEHCYPGGREIRRALEAALADVPEPALDSEAVGELWGRWTAWAMQHESMQKRRDPETEPLHEDAALAYRRCAAELRKRAKKL